MAFISSSAETEKFKRFKEYLQNGNVKEVKKNLEPEYVDEIIDHDYGMRPIHWTCEKGHFEIVNLLIEKKCNIESEDRWGMRPIHWACEKGHFEIVNLLIEKKCNIESEDKLGRRPIHWACDKGHFEIVNLLIEKKCNIESEDKLGRRPIHWACDKGHFEILNLLIEKKCNIESEDKLGMRPIHWACEKGHFEILNLLIEKKCNIESEDKSGWSPIHYACEKGRFKIVNLLIEKNCNIECQNKERMRMIHLACEKGHVEIVNLLIEKNCNIECQDKEGRRPIHLACLKGSKEIVKLLISHKCFINVSDNDRQTPLDIAKSKGHGGIMKLLSELDKITKTINDSTLKNDDKSFAKFYKSNLLTGGKWLEIAWKQKADKIIKYFLDRPLDVTEIGYIKTVFENNQSKSTNAELWEEVLLYKSIKDDHVKGFQYICRSHIINRPTKIIPCSFLELATENGNLIFVQEIMRKSVYDSEIWNREKEIALHKGFHRIHNSISNREYMLKCREKNNISILHTAVCDNDPEMIEFILREGLVDANHNHEVLGTALAFAILLCHRECLTVFERFNIDCNTQNKYLQSPLHEAISNGVIEYCQYLMDHVKNIDQPGFMGQTALHCAVIQGCEELCDQLIEKGADCLRYMELHQPLTEKKEPLQLSHRENSLTLCVKMNRTIYPCFLKSLDINKANSYDDEGNTLLHLSANLMKPDLCKVLLDGGANIDSLNKKGNTPLFELLSNLDQQSFISNEDKIIETVNLFVQYGCDLDKGLKEDLSLIEIITKFNSERLLLALSPRQQNQLFEIDENLLIIALDRNFYQFCVSLLNLFPKENLKSSISTIIIEEALKHNCTKLLKYLVLNAGDDVQQVVLEFSLYHLAKLDDKDSFECLLNIEIKNPFCFGDGESLLTRLLKEERFYFCQRIIKSKVNKRYINFKNERNQTPLQVAIETDSMDVILNDLTFETDVIDNMDCEGRTALIQLFVKISDNTDEDRHSRLMNAIKAIICKGGNIYHETSNGKTVIEFCSSSLVREEIETFQNIETNFRYPVREKIIEREKVVVVKETEIERKTCGICLDREVDSVFQCGHTICEVCSGEIFRCPFCNFEPAQAKRIYFN